MGLIPFYRFQFPKDHAPHPEFDFEWWHHVGNVKSDSGEQFGYQLTIFRKKVFRKDAYVAHLALSDITRGRYRYLEAKTGRAVSMVEDGRFNLFLKGFSLNISGHKHRLIAGGEDFAINLILSGKAEPVLNGKDGRSQKGKDKYGYYYSVNDLETSGEIRVGAKHFKVEGLSWMDHEFFSSRLERGIVGWDWFGLHLDDGSKLMVYKLRIKGGGYHEASSGTLCRDGAVKHLPSSSMTTLPEFGSLYPSGVRLVLPNEGIDIFISSIMPNQEFRSKVVGINYFEGSVFVSGTHQGKGYAEFTGYDKPLTGSFGHVSLKYLASMLSKIVSQNPLTGRFANG